MRRYDLTVTESFRRLPMVTDDIPVPIIESKLPYFQFIIKLGDGKEAYLYVHEDTVDKKAEYFMFINKEE